MSKGYDDGYLNHIHPIGQDGFKSNEEIETEEIFEKIKEENYKLDKIYLQNHPFC